MAYLVFFIGLMGVGGSLDTGRSPLGALVLMALSLPGVIKMIKQGGKTE